MCAFKTRFSSAFLFAVAIAAVSTQAHALQDTRSRISNLIDDLAKAQTIHDAAISPDGTMLAWTVKNTNGTHLQLTGLANPIPASDRLISSAPEATQCTDESPAWSPDGKQLAFLSDCSTPNQTQLYSFDMSTGKTRKLTNLKGFLQSPAWSPDGTHIGFLFVENATRPSGALAAMKPPSGVIGEDGIEIQRVATVNAANGVLEQITPAHLHVYEFNWSPDSKQLAYVAAPPPGENNWWVAKLYGQPLRGEAHVVLDPGQITGQLHGLQIAVPRWSPDGKRIAFIGGLMSDQGVTGGDIYVIPASGGEPVDITPGIDGTPTFESWIDDNRIGFVEERRGHILLPDYDVAKREYIAGSSVDLGEVSVGGGGFMDAISISRNGIFAFVKTSFGTPPEVWAGKIDQLRQITHVNDALKPTWGKAESIEWTNEGFHIQGWLLYPANYNPAKKYPLITMVHGGPSSAVTPHWPGVGYGGVPFSAMGYFVFMPNPRGSYGQGEKFTQANIKDFGYGDLRDILAGLDTIEKRLPVDPNRIGLTGWSYGGFMTMFDITQTHRFKAAVAGAGISNWQSYYGENSIDQWMIPFFGASVYDDPAVYAKSSAINFIKQIKTPTLVVVGDRDGECPAPQSFEFWHALKAQGVPTRLVVYPDEGHGFRNPDHRKDVLVRAIEWFEQYMPASQ